MKALIPVAGYGKRLKPHTDHYQKALIPVAGKPALDFILNPLISSGITKIVFIVGHFKNQVIEHMKNFEGDFSYVEQKERLGLGHAVLMGLDDVDEPILIQLGDTIFNINYAEFCSAKSNTIGVVKVDDPRRYGVVEVEGNRVINFYEKHPNPPSNLAISGLYYFSSEIKLKSALEELVKRNITTNNEYQITDALQLMVEHGEEFKVFPTPNYHDVGVPEALLETNRKLLKSDHLNFDSSKIIEPVFVGENCIIEDSIIGPFVTIMDDCHIKNSKIEDSIVLEYSQILDQQINGKIVAKDGNEYC